MAVSKTSKQAKKKPTKGTKRIIEMTGAKKQKEGGVVKIKGGKTKRIGKAEEKTGRIQELKETKEPTTKGWVLKNNVKHNGRVFKKGFQVKKDNCDYNTLIKFC